MAVQFFESIDTDSNQVLSASFLENTPDNDALSSASDSIINPYKFDNYQNNTQITDHHSAAPILNPYQFDDRRENAQYPTDSLSNPYKFYNYNNESPLIANNTTEWNKASTKNRVNTKNIQRAPKDSIATSPKNNNDSLLLTESIVDSIMLPFQFTPKDRDSTLLATAPTDLSSTNEESEADNEDKALKTNKAIAITPKDSSIINSTPNTLTNDSITPLVLSHNVPSHQTDTITIYKEIGAKTNNDLQDSITVLCDNYKNILANLSLIKQLLNNMASDNKKDQEFVKSDTTNTKKESDYLKSNDLKDSMNHYFAKSNTYKTLYSSPINEANYKALLKTKKDSITQLQTRILELENTKLLIPDTIYKTATKQTLNTLIVQTYINDTIHLTKEIVQTNTDTVFVVEKTDQLETKQLYDTINIVGYYYPNSRTPNNILEIRTRFANIDVSKIVMVYMASYTDISGSEAMNYALSRERSEEIEKMLTDEYKIDDLKIYKQYFGSSFASKKRVENERRIEISIISKPDI